MLNILNFLSVFLLYLMHVSIIITFFLSALKADFCIIGLSTEQGTQYMLSTSIQITEKGSM